MAPVVSTKASTSSWSEFGESETEGHHSTLVHIQDTAVQKLEKKNYEEPRCCQLCLSTKLATFTVTIFLLLMGTLVVFLDLTIWEVERLNRGRYYYWSNYEDSATNNVSIIVKGTASKYEVFERISLSSMSDQVVHLELDYVEVSFQNLENALHEHSETLRTLILTNVKITGHLLTKGYYGYYGDGPGIPDIRNLNSFVLKLNQATGPEEELKVDLCDNCIVSNASKFSGDPFSTFKDPNCFKSLIPFTRRYYIYSGNIITLYMSLTLSVYDWTYFKLNFEEGEITSMVSQSNEILVQIPVSDYGPATFILRKLSLKNCDLEASTLPLFSSSLTHLVLDTVNITGLPEGAPISQILTTLTKLEHLSLKNSLFMKYYDARSWRQLGISANMFDLLSKVPRKTVELSQFPTTLKNLSISDYDLVWDSRTPNETSLNFNLDLLALHRVNVLNDSIVNNFQKLFKCKKFAFQPWDPRIRSNNRESTKNGLDIINVVYASSGVSWMFLDNAVTRRDFDDTDSDSLSGINMLLSDHELPPTTPRIIFDKKNHPSFWEAKSFASPNDARLLWFQLLHMETFMPEDLALDSTW